MASPALWRRTILLVALGASLLVALGASLAMVGAATGWLFIDRKRPLRIATDDPSILARGAALYVEHCAACHGADLEGEPDWRVRRADGTLPAPPHDATGHTWHHADADLVAMTKHGIAPFAPPGYRSAMPAFADSLDDTEIIAILAHIKSQWSPEVRRLQERLNE